MANLAVRYLPGAVHDRLRAQAKSKRRRLEAEVRSIRVQSAIASSAEGFGYRIRARSGRYFVDDLSVEGDQTTRKPGVFD